jgi:N-acetylmuramoyl-L-alanine amidase
MMSSVAIVIGHTFEAPGLRSDIIGDSEWYFWRDQCDEYFSRRYDVFEHYIYASSYTRRQEIMGDMTKDYDWVFELHFNGADSPQANGVEAFHYFSNPNTKAFSEYYCARMSEVLGIKNRGAKPLYSKSQRGFGFINEMRGNAVLLEPFFATNKDDVYNFNPYQHFSIFNECVERYC